MASGHKADRPLTPGLCEARKAFVKLRVMVSRQELGRFFDSLLAPQNYEDYGPNGLQIEGRETIQKVAFAVSATRESVQQAVDYGAHALVVHHGLFWSFHGPRPITGVFARRVKPLIQHEINLWGYHLPLDAHPLVGNAAGLARRLGIVQHEDFCLSKGAYLGQKGELERPLLPEEFAQRLQDVAGHEVRYSCPDPQAKIQSVGIVTGGANKYWKQALRDGLDAFITGEISEHDWHESQEAGVCYFAAGHHATERFGVLDLERAMQREFSGIESTFFDSENPA